MPTPLAATSGTLINIAAVAAGTTLGRLMGTRLPARFQDTIMQGLGLATLLLGVLDGQQTRNPLYVLTAILFGAVLGEWLDLDGALERLGTRLQVRFAREGSRLSEAFVTSSLVFCIGPLAILGSLQNGIDGNNQSLVFKSMLDGFAAFAFSATLGWGVILSVVTIAIFQGGLSLGAGLISPLVDKAMIAEMSATGGLIILGIGLRLLQIKQLRIGNFLPALLVAPVAVKLVEVLHPCLGACGH